MKSVFLATATKATAKKGRRPWSFSISTFPILRSSKIKSLRTKRSLDFPILIGNSLKMRPSLVLAISLWQSMTTVLGDNSQISVWLENNSGAALDLKWVNPNTKEAVDFSSWGIDEKRSFGSYAGHEFEIHEMPSADSGLCESSADKTCRINRFSIAAGVPEQGKDATKGLSAPPQAAK